MGRHHSLATRHDFRRVYGEGRTARQGDLRVVAAERADPRLPSRLGLAIRGCRRRAVVRNRVKRRLREAFRLHGPSAGYDVVVQADEGTNGRTFQEIVDDLKIALGKAGVKGKES